MDSSLTKRIVIEAVTPEIEEGRYPAKRVTGQEVVVEADVFTDGHEMVSALLLHRGPAQKTWRKSGMIHLGNDRWRGSFTVEKQGIYRYTLRGWINRYRTWCRDIAKKLEAGQEISVDLEIGANMLRDIHARASGRNGQYLERVLASTDKTAGGRVSLMTDEKTMAVVDDLVGEDETTVYGKELLVQVDRRKTLFSAWYEIFPRSCSRSADTHGTFGDCEALLTDIAELGFDVLYLPPIHPIGKTHRKGRNNETTAGTGDPGSPWAIGSAEGGHRAVHPSLGTMEDFTRLVKKAQGLGLEVAIDLAFQCSPDHPYVRDHPEWFSWRPDGTVQYAENPPKKYEDILPINFNTEDWKALWEELKGVVLFWIEKGVTVFRVDNPHTKPFGFWEWLIGEVRKSHPDVFFLAEAFTRPKVMYRLGKLGYSQSYTYFTWRNTKRDIEAYMKELTSPPLSDFFRPCFWPNTPDILPDVLQYGGRTGFILRLILAATLSSSYGIYGPAYELCVSAALPGKEEYLDSEKYEIKSWDRKAEGNIREIVARVNAIRRENEALQETKNIAFFEIDNDSLIFYGKTTPDLDNVILVAVNLDPFNIQSGRVRLDLDRIGIAPDQPFLVHDLITDEKYIWRGEYNFVSLNPTVFPAHVLKVHREHHREEDFDYFM